MGKNSILLIGDAAGLVEPVTEEGISYAIKGAGLCAEAILKVEDKLKIHDKDNSLCKKEIIQTMFQGYFARYLLYGKYFQPLALRKLGKDKVWANGLMNILFGEYTYLKYFKKIMF